MSGRFMAVYDVAADRRYYLRGGETYVEKPSDERPRRCMPVAWDGSVGEKHVLGLCERVPSTA